MSAADLNTAMIRYLGYKTASHPGANFDAVIDAIGLERARAVEFPMLSVLADLDRIQPDWRIHSLYNGSEWAVRQLRLGHPALDDPAAKALAWAFSYWNK